ncbi:hypothetical protein VF21_01585 [Pseudogymnoascus sp. 05NY08]|nr:hypothetical protein VF21_01585 [Pseudogymnoascus sp. 05NY08]
MFNGNRPNEETQRTLTHEELSTAIIPGTECMADVGNLHFKHSGKNVLIPQPSNDPSDPLNWNRKWKAAAMIGMAISSFANGFGPLSIGPQVPFYMAEWDKSVDDVINFTGICILVLGFSNLVWVPVARLFGRRPALWISMTIGIASAVWRATATSYESFIGACVLSGFACGPGETFGPMLVADVMFLHERGFYMGLYQWAYWGGIMVGPIVAGAMSDRYGWRSFWWLNVGILSFALVYQICFLPETKWTREANTLPTAGAFLDAQEKELNQFTEIESTNDIPGPNQTVHRLASEETLFGGPNRNQFLPFSKYERNESLLQALWIPIRVTAFPIVQWASFVFSWSASCFLVANITQSAALAGPPWNFSAAAVGYTNLALFGGASIALVTAGPLSDWISMRATMHNNGIREPEMRLPTLILFSAAALLGGLIVSYGYQYGWPWEAIVILGYTLLGMQLAALAAIATTYAIDSYKPVAGEFLISATVVKNLWGYGLSQFLNPWIVKSGYVLPIMVNTALTLFFICLAIPLFFYGKRVRYWSANSTVHSSS